MLRLAVMSLLCGRIRLKRKNCIKIPGHLIPSSVDFYLFFFFLRSKGQIGSACPCCKGMNWFVVFFAIQKMGLCRAAYPNLGIILVAVTSTSIHKHLLRRSLFKLRKKTTTTKQQPQTNYDNKIAGLSSNRLLG